jgi:hypothetical protein
MNRAKVAPPMLSRVDLSYFWRPKRAACANAAKMVMGIQTSIASYELSVVFAPEGIENRVFGLPEVPAEHVALE